MERRGPAFARLFEAVHEGVYIGTVGRDSTTTFAANAHLKLIFGYASETAEADVRPFDVDRFVDPQARSALITRLETDGAVNDYLLRLRRADNSAVWIELTARIDAPASCTAFPKRKGCAARITAGCGQRTVSAWSSLTRRLRTPPAPSKTG